MIHDKRLVPLSQIQHRPLGWLWDNRILLGSINVLDGDPGQGKSAVSYDLAARVSRGDAMPLGASSAGPAGVVLLQGEDDVASVVRPRLEAAGADLSRVIAYDRTGAASGPLTLPDDLTAIEKAVADVQARLLVIDPVSAFLSVNPTSDVAVRQLLTPLAAFAEHTGVAVVLVRHLTKAGSRNALYRGAGSIGIIAAARSGLLAAADPAADQPHRHVLVQTKCNLASAESLTFRTRKRGDSIVIEWLGTSSCTAAEVAAQGGTEPRALGEALWALYSFLSDGPVPAREVIKLAAAAGVAKRTLDRAKRVLGVIVRKVGSGTGSWWTWELPDDEERLRPFRERDRAERLQVIRRQVAGRQAGDAWQTPARDADLFEIALAERGLEVVRLGGRDLLWRAADVCRLPLVERLTQANAAGDGAARAALHDLLIDLGIRPEQVE